MQEKSNKLNIFVVTLLYRCARWYICIVGWNEFDPDPCCTYCTMEQVHLIFEHVLGPHVLSWHNIIDEKYDVLHQYLINLNVNGKVKWFALLTVCCGRALKVSYAITFPDCVEGFRKVWINKPSL